MESVSKFAGEHPEIAKYYPKNDSFLLVKEEKTKKIEEEDINLYNYKNMEEKQSEKKRLNITDLAT